MICTSIQNRNFEQIKAVLADPSIEMAEIRLDLCPIAVEEITELFRNAAKPLVATYRFKGNRPQEHTLNGNELTTGCYGWDRLSAAIEAGAMFADLELSEEAVLIEKEFTELCRRNGTRIIRSYHNFESTPGLVTLKKKARMCFEAGADIAKIATTARNFKDTCTIDSLYDWFNDEYGRHAHHELIAFAMGELGRVSRVDCLMNGSPFTYASLNAYECTAPGQLNVEELNGLLYNKKKLYLNKIYDSVPASKSYAQRAIIAAALAQGTSRIDNYTPCADSETAIEVARALGATVSKEYTPKTDSQNINGHRNDNKTCQTAVCALVINGIGAYGKTHLHIAELHTGESGLLTRLMVPLLSLFNDCNCRITGERTLVGRPLKGLSETMAMFGVQFTGTDKEQDINVPFTINVSDTNADIKAKNGSPSLTGIVSYNHVPETMKLAVDGSNGSQIISGLMMSLPLCGHDSEIIVKNPKSVPYLEITSDVLRNFGITINISDSSGTTVHKADKPEISNSVKTEEKEPANRDKTDERISLEIQGNQKYQAADIYLEADWSGAANLLVAGAILGSAEVHGLNRGSLQGDSVILDILAKAGANVSVNSTKAQIHSSNQANNKGHLQSGQNCSTGCIQPQHCAQNEAGHTSDSTADIVTVVKAPLRAFNVSLENAPDLFPIVALLAAFCSGESRIEGTHRLVGKESNRVQAIVEMLRQMGVPVCLEDNTMIIKGENLSSRILNQRLPKGGKYSSHHDHRIAMALSVAKLCTRYVIEIDDTECIAKSFPNFEC